MPGKILLIDDDKNLLRVTEYNLSSAGFSVKTAASGKKGMDLFLIEKPDLVITDVKLGDYNGLELLENVKKNSPDIPVIVLTAFGTIEMAVSAMRKGAFTFIQKPFDRDTLRLSCKKALEMKMLRSRNRVLSEEVKRLTGFHKMATVNSAMKDLLNTAIKVADSEATILIAGESGTGKELLARLIHQHSPRMEGPMVVVNCAAIPDGLIESELFGHLKGAFSGAVSSRKGRFLTASGGTLFLDEIGDVKPEMQVKLLRAIQEREFEPVGSERSVKTDIRIVSATNKDLKNAVKKGNFREDLFYRLSVIPLHIPPLRNRSEDIPALVDHFLKKFDAPSDVKFSTNALEIMRKYAWPGNIRELKNMVERCLILRKGTTIGGDALKLPSDCTENFQMMPELPEQGISLEKVERELIIKALEKSNNNRSQAARLLKIPRHVLIYRIEKYGLSHGLKNSL